MSSCKWYGDNTIEEVNKDNVMTFTESGRMLNDTDKIIGLSEEKIKTLSAQDLSSLVSEARIDAEKSNNEVTQKKNGNNGKNIEVKDAPKLVELIKKSSEKIDLAFKALIGAGYNVSSAAKNNLENGLKMINLLDELLKIAVIDGKDNSNSKYNALKKAVDDFNNKNSSICVSLEDSSNKSVIKVNKCVKTLMNNVETYFEGLYNELKDKNKDEHGNMITLSEAVCKIKSAAMAVHVYFNLN
ncbi:hypothetical protein [Borreliella carolinensis]|uniref:hypothetical protein n=1 Tax=Borreliella carolinensis TaxID=478174 RepID=UPI003AF18177